MTAALHRQIAALYPEQIEYQRDTDKYRCLLCFRKDGKVKEFKPREGFFKHMLLKHKDDEASLFDEHNQTICPLCESTLMAPSVFNHLTTKEHVTSEGSLVEYAKRKKLKCPHLIRPENIPCDWEKSSHSAYTYHHQNFHAGEPRLSPIELVTEQHGEVDIQDKQPDPFVEEPQETSSDEGNEDHVAGPAESDFDVSTPAQEANILDKAVTIPIADLRENGASVELARSLHAKVATLLNFSAAKVRDEGSRGRKRRFNELDAGNGPEGATVEEEEEEIVEMETGTVGDVWSGSY